MAIVLLQLRWISILMEMYRDITKFWIHSARPTISLSIYLPYEYQDLFFTNSPSWSVSRSKGKY